MTPTQAARMIGCSVSQVRTLIRKGKIKAHKETAHKPYRGYHYDIDLKEVRRYAKTQPGGWPRGQSRPKP